MAYVYFIRAARSGMIKIGTALKPEERLRELQTGSHERLEFLAAVPGTADLERRLHETFAEARAEGEWFHPTQELLDLIDAVRERRFDATTPRTAAERIRVRRKRVERDKAKAMKEAIQAAADRAGMSPSDWVWNVAMPKVVEIALADTSPSDAFSTVTGAPSGDAL